MFASNNISKTLRLTGIIVLIISVVQFLMSGRYDLNSFMAHNLFLGLNALLCLLGIVAHKKFQDPKTARTFLGLSLAMLPSQFAQLSAFIFNRFQGTPSFIPEMAQIALPEGIGILTVSIATILILIPILFLGFHVLNRDDAKKLSLIYGIQSLLILLPIRDNNIIFPISVLSVAGFLFAQFKMPKSKSFEMQMSKLFLLIPTALLLGRGAMYPNASFIYTTIFYLLGFLTAKSIPSILEEKFKNQFLPTLFYRFSNLFFILGSTFLAESLSLPLYGTFLFIAATCYLTLFMPKVRDVFMLGGGHFFFTMGSVLFMDRANLISQYLYLLLPLAGAYIAFYLKDKISFAWLSILFVLLIIFVISHSFTFYFLMNWHTMAILGIVCIIFSAVIERKAKSIVHKFQLALGHFD